MRMVPHKSELGKGLKDEANGLLFVIASLLCIALLLLMVASAKATRVEIPPENDAVEQPNSVDLVHSSSSDGSERPDADALRAAFLHVMASLGG